MSTDSEQQNTPSKPIVIILDTNAIQAFLNDDTATELAGFLDEVQALGVVLAASDVSLYEALKSIVFDAKKTESVTSFFDNYLTRYLTDENILINAARVHEMYGADTATKGNRHSCSSEDIIIATTAMIEGAYVFTSDGNDYPMPFFKEMNRVPIYYQVGSRRKYKVFYLLEPDSDVIGDAIAKLEGADKVEKPKKSKK